MASPFGRCTGDLSERLTGAIAVEEKQKHFHSVLMLPIAKAICFILLCDCAIPSCAFEESTLQIKLVLEKTLAVPCT